MKFTISAKLLASFALLLLLVIGIGVYTLSVSRNALEESVGQGSVFIVEDMIQRIDKDVFLKMEELARFTSDPLLRACVDSSNRAFVDLEDVDAYIEEQEALWAAGSSDETAP